MAFKRVLLIFLLSGTLAYAQQNQQQFELRSGLTVSFTAGNDLPLIQARLYINHLKKNDLPDNFFLTELLILNLFDDEAAPNNLAADIRELGGDFSYECHPDYFVCNFQFLNESLTDFFDLIKKIFNFRNFNLNTFNKSKEILRKKLKNSDSNTYNHLKQELLFAQIFSSEFLKKNSLNLKNLQKLNLSQINSLYKQIFQPQNGMLIIQGSINPHLTVGLLEKRLISEKKEPSQFTNYLPPSAIQENRIFFFSPENEKADPASIEIKEIFNLSEELTPQEFEFLTQIKIQTLLEAINPGFFNQENSFRLFSTHLFNNYFISSIKVSFSAEDLPAFFYNYLRLRKQLGKSQLNRILFIEKLKLFLGRKAIQQLDPLYNLNINSLMLLSSKTLNVKNRSHIQPAKFVSWENARQIIGEIEQNFFQFFPVVIIQAPESLKRLFPDFEIVEISFN